MWDSDDEDGVDKWWDVSTGDDDNGEWWDVSTGSESDEYDAGDEGSFDPYLDGEIDDGEYDVDEVEY